MFKIGDKVHCTNHNKDGIVTSVNSKYIAALDYPIAVGFEDGSFEYYKEDGRLTTRTSVTLNLIDELSAGNTHVG